MPEDTDRDARLEVLLRATRALSGVTATALAQVDDQVTPQQLRVLVLVATRSAVTPSEVAAALDVHASSATRLCDRLVAAGRVVRRQDPDDRRRITLHLTPSGRGLLTRVRAHRRRRLAAVLDALPEEDLDLVCSSLERLSDALGEATLESVVTDL